MARSPQRATGTATSTATPAAALASPRSAGAGGGASDGEQLQPKQSELTGGGAVAVARGLQQAASASSPWPPPAVATRPLRTSSLGADGSKVSAAGALQRLAPQVAVVPPPSSSEAARGNQSSLHASSATVSNDERGAGEYWSGWSDTSWDVVGAVGSAAAAVAASVQERERQAERQWEIAESRAWNVCHELLAQGASQPPTQEGSPAFPDTGGDLSWPPVRPSSARWAATSTTPTSAHRLSALEARCFELERALSLRDSEVQSLQEQRERHLLELDALERRVNELSVQDVAMTRRLVERESEVATYMRHAQELERELRRLARDRRELIADLGGEKPVTEVPSVSVTLEGSEEPRFVGSSRGSAAATTPATVVGGGRGAVGRRGQRRTMPRSSTGGGAGATGGTGSSPRPQRREDPQWR